MEEGVSESFVLESGRILYQRKHKLLLLPPQGEWQQYPKGASWGGWPVPYGWEPAVSPSGAVYFLNHIGQRVDDTLPKVASSVRVGGKEVRLVSLVPRPNAPMGFKCAHDNPRLIERVAPNSPADAGQRGLHAGDVIVRVDGVDAQKLSAPALKQLIKSRAQQVLVLTVLSERSDDSLCTVRVEFEDGSEPFSHSLGSHDTVEALLNEVLVRRGIRGKSRKLFRLRVATPPYAPVAWMDPTATLESLGGEPCIVSMQMLPGSMEELLEYDPTAFAYLVAQLGRWIDVGLIDFTDEDMAACLASYVLAPELERARVKGDRRRWDVGLLDRPEFLGRVVPISLRISLDDLKGLKKRVITELRARESKEMTEAELTMDMLNHAVSLGVLGVVRHKLNFNGTLHDLAVSSHTIHMIKDVATLQQKRICTVDQIVEASLEEGEGEGEGVVIVSIATSSGKREYTFTGPTREAGAFAATVTAYYAVVVSSKKTLLNDASARRMASWLGREDALRGAVTPMASADPTDPDAAPQPREYRGVHTVMSVGWNYDDAIASTAAAVAAEAAAAAAASGTKDAPAMRVGGQWHTLTLPFAELNGQTREPVRRRTVRGSSRFSYAKASDGSDDRAAAAPEDPSAGAAAPAQGEGEAMAAASRLQRARSINDHKRDSRASPDGPHSARLPPPPIDFSVAPPPPTAFDGRETGGGDPRKDGRMAVVRASSVLEPSTPGTAMSWAPPLETPLLEPISFAPPPSFAERFSHESVTAPPLEPPPPPPPEDDGAAQAPRETLQRRRGADSLRRSVSEQTSPAESPIGGSPLPHRTRSVDSIGSGAGLSKLPSGRANSGGDNSELREGIELVKRGLAMIKSRMSAPSRGNSDESLDQENLSVTLRTMWGLMKRLVGAVWEIADVLASAVDRRDSDGTGRVDDRLMRQEAAEACQLLGRTLEMGLTLPPVELKSGQLAEPIVYLKDLAVAFLRVLNLVLKSRSGGAGAGAPAVAAVVAPFVDAATVTMKMLASNGSQAP